MADVLPSDSPCDAEKDEAPACWDNHLDYVLPELSIHLGLHDLLNLRLLSKTWLSQVDNFLCQENPLVRPYKEQLYTRTLHHRLPSSYLHQEKCHFTKIMEQYNFHRSAVLTGFTRRMINQLKNGSNPFLCRYVSLGLVNVEIEEDPKIIFRNVPEFWVNVEKFMHHWGHHIWYLQYSDDGHTHTAVEYYLLLLKCLESAPDLRLLDLSSIHLDYSRRSQESLEEIIGDNPPPPLPALESLLFPERGKLPEPIQHILVRTYSRQLKNLRFPLGVCAENYPHVVTELSELSVFRIPNNEKLTETLGLFTLPRLHKLTLNLKERPKISSWSIERVMELFQDFPVKVVSLILGNEVPLKETSVTVPIRDQFQVETLHTLEMNHCPGTSYNFLWCLPGLKHLHVEFNPYKDGDLKGNLVKLLVGTGSVTQVKEEDQEVDIREFVENGGDMYESNVWTVVPKLEILSYTKLHWCWWPTRKVYRREIYQWQRKQSLRVTPRLKSKTRSRRRGKWETHNRKTIVGMSEEDKATTGAINMRRLYSYE